MQHSHPSPGFDQWKTFVKMPVTPGCTIFAHLFERQEVRDWYDCNPCLKSALEITVGFCAPAEDRTGTGLRGRHSLPPVLQSGFRPFFCLFFGFQKKSYVNQRPRLVAQCAGAGEGGVLSLTELCSLLLSCVYPGRSL